VKANRDDAVRWSRFGQSSDFQSQQLRGCGSNFSQKSKTPRRLTSSGGLVPRDRVELPTRGFSVPIQRNHLKLLPGVEAEVEASHPGIGRRRADLGEVVKRRLAAVVELTGGEVTVQEVLVRALVLGLEQVILQELGGTELR